MLPAVGLGVDLVPGQADDVGQKPFGEAVLADDAGGQLATGRGQGDRASPDLDVARLTQAVHHLRHGGGRVAHPFGQPGLYDLAALLFQVVDRLQVLLVGRVGAGPAGTAAHAPSVLLRRGWRPRVPGAPPRATRSSGPRAVVARTLGVERPVTGAGTPGRYGLDVALLMLLDGNSLTYRAFFALPTDLATASGQVTNAVYGFTSMLVNLIKDHHPDRLAVAFDRPEPTFRHDLVPGYKATRSSRPRHPPPADGPGAPAGRHHAHPGSRDARVRGRRCPGHAGHQAAAAGDDVIVVTGDRDTYQLVEDPHLKVLYNRRGVSDYVLYDEAGIAGAHGRDARPSTPSSPPFGATRRTTCPASPGWARRRRPS